MQYPAHFLDAVAMTLEHEGGYANDTDDPGGETRFGISKRRYPDVDIANLTRRRAIHLYYEDFWAKYGYSRLEDREVAGKVFDLAVNMGPRQAHLCAQRACRANHLTITQDGILGPVTIETLNNLPPLAVLTALRAEAAGFYRLLATRKPVMSKFLKGWLSRAYS